MPRSRSSPAKRSEPGTIARPAGDRQIRGTAAHAVAVAKQDRRRPGGQVPNSRSSGAASVRHDAGSHLQGRDRPMAEDRNQVKDRNNVRDAAAAAAAAAEAAAEAAEGPGGGGGVPVFVGVDVSKARLD